MHAPAGSRPLAALAALALGAAPAACAAADANVGGWLVTRPAWAADDAARLLGERGQRSGLGSQLDAKAAPPSSPMQRRDQQQPASGAPAALDERGLTNHPLDYDPITNEHTARMALARKAGIEAYEGGRWAAAASGRPGWQAQAPLPPPPPGCLPLAYEGSSFTADANKPGGRVRHPWTG